MKNSYCKIWDKQAWKEQPLQFRLTASGKEGVISDVKLQIDNYAEMVLPVVLKAGESIVCDGTTLLKMYSKTGKLLTTYKLKELPPVLGQGNHTIIADCSFDGEEPPKIEMQFKGVIKTESCELIK